MAIRRIWLNSWEWDCCGEPFRPGDTMDFAVTSPPPDWLAEYLGAAASEVAAVESHHEEGGDQRWSGTVRGVSSVATPHLATRVRRPPRPDGGTDLPRFDFGNGVVAIGGSRSEWITSVEPVAGEPRFTPIAGVRQPATDATNDAHAEPPEGLHHRVVGYLVELDMAE
ncbi:hypothetical protein KXS11_09640 [Plantibacter flavus]|uniref:DUF6578 domain-containing protein n=1 Tax=Plantibacter flavus TaxID=150123 RepID=UPI003F154D29